MSQIMLNLGIMGMTAQSEKLETIGNNIANARTTAYKSNSISFAEEFATRKGSSKNGVNRQFTNGVSVSGSSKDWNSGPIENTNTQTHLAIDGAGFIAVEFKGDTLYTRAGDFSIIEDNGVFVLSRPSGAKLMGATAQNGDPAGQVQFSQVPSSFSIDSKTGQVIATDDNGDSIVTNGFITIHRFANPDALENIEGGMFMENNFTSRFQDGGSSLRQGMLEASNVDLAKQFTDLIVSQRSFSANTRTIRTADEMMQEVLGLKR